MRYRMMGTDPKTRREVSVISLGAMLMGTLTDEATSFAVLDRYANVRADKPLGPGFDHPGTRARQAALRTVAEETGATVNQVVLAWLIGGEVPVVPLVGASSVAQLDESLAAVDLELTAEQRATLDAAH